MSVSARVSPHPRLEVRRLVALGLLSAPLHAQEPAPPSPAPQAEPLASLTELVASAARERLGDPALLGRVGEDLRPGRIERVLEDLHLFVKAFERDSGGDPALGFSFHVAKTLAVTDESVPRALDFVARGNVAFQTSANPDDLVETVLRVRWGGTRSLGDGQETRLDVAEHLDAPEVEELAAIDSRRFTELSARAVQGSEARLREDPDFRALVGSYLERVEKRLAPELVWDFDLHAGLETQQDLSDHQWVLGSALSGRLLSWDPEAKLSRYNPFDFPGAAVRWLAGQEGFRPSGLAYPTVVAGFDFVDATRDGGRRPVTEFDSFLRARLELALESHVLDVGGEELSLSAGWRYYQEVDAPAEVRELDQDASSYFELGLELPRGWALTYSVGRLPLDTHDDSTFALGFAFEL